MADDVQYQPVSPDPQKACQNCKHFESDESTDNKVGKCFGHEVEAQATCKYFESKGGEV